MCTDLGYANKVGVVQGGGREKVASSMTGGGQDRRGRAGQDVLGGVGCAVFGRKRTERGLGWLLL